MDSPVGSVAPARRASDRQSLGPRVLVASSDYQKVLHSFTCEDLVEHVVDGESEAGLVDQQLLHQEGVEVVGVHHIIPAHHTGCQHFIEHHINSKLNLSYKLVFVFNYCCYYVLLLVSFHANYAMVLATFVNITPFLLPLVCGARQEEAE